MDYFGKYFSDFDPRIKSKLDELPGLYQWWNSKVNLISRKDIENIAIHHILHSLAIARVIRFAPGTQVMDAGTGGGFPGIPLAILFPEALFTLVDSIGKKITVVNELIKALGLKNCRGVSSRFEQMGRGYHFIVSRAVTALPGFVGLAAPLVLKEGKNTLQNGILYLKGGDFTDELSILKYYYTVYPINDFFDEAYFETKSVLHIKT